MFVLDGSLCAVFQKETDRGDCLLRCGEEDGCLSIVV